MRRNGGLVVATLTRKAMCLAVGPMLLGSSHPILSISHFPIDHFLWYIDAARDGQGVCGPLDRCAGRSDCGNPAASKFS